MKQFSKEELKVKSQKAILVREMEDGTIVTDEYTTDYIFVAKKSGESKEATEEENGVLAVTGSFVGNSKVLSQLSEVVAEEEEKRQPDFKGMMKRLMSILGGDDEDGDGEEHEHRCEDCGSKDFCPLPQAVDYRSGNDKISH